MKLSFYAARALDLVLFLIIVWILVGYVCYALVAPPTFDGAMNLNTALSFVDGHGYGFFYNEFFPFPAQTDGPFTLPAAILMRLGGITPLTTQGVNLAYLGGTVVLTFLLFRRITRSSTFALAGAAVILTTPGLFPVSMGGFGEIPCMFWLLLSLLILAPVLDRDSPSKFRLFFGGITLALCLLTKMVGLFLVAPTLALFTMMFVLQHRRDKQHVALVAAGVATPMLGWELFRLIEIGGWQGYLEWWSLQLGQMLRQSGADEALSPNQGSIAKGTEHLHILGNLTGTPSMILAIFLLVPWLLILAVLVHRLIRRDFGNVFCVSACAAASVLYFVWWLVIEQTQMAWLRRIVDGLMLQQILLVVAIVVLFRVCRVSGRFALPRRLMAACILVVLVFSGSFLIANGETLTRPPMATKADIDTWVLASKIRNLPADATLFGFGWWKDPVLALLSGRMVMNFYYWDPAKIDALPDKYLIVDYAAKALANQEVQEILLTTTSHVVADGPGGTIYKLDKVLPYKAFTIGDFEPSALRTKFTIAEGPYAATRGFYSPEGKAAWAKPDAALLLRRSNQTQLSLSVYVPPQLKQSDPTQTLQLHVISEGCVDAVVPFEPGVRTIVLPLICPPSSEPQSMEVLLSVNGHIPTVQQIDADQRRLAYLVTDIRLQGP
jgi:hypothetical protein